MEYSFKIDTDYRMIYFEDYEGSIGANIDWNQEDINSKILTFENSFIIETAHEGEVTINVSICKHKPKLNIQDWDHIILLGLNLKSDNLLVSGTMDYVEDYINVQIDAGIYGIYVCYEGLDSVSNDGLDGDDRYHVFIWKEPQIINKEIIKQF